MQGARVSTLWLIAPFAALAVAAPALAAAGDTKGPSVAIFIGQILELIIAGRLLGEAMLRLGQPAVMGQLIAGLLLGPSLFGYFLPDLQHGLFPKSADQKAMIDGVAQIGVLLLLLITGMETDLKLVRQTGRAAVFASLMGIVIPFLCGFTLGEFLPDAMLPDPDKRLIAALFLGTALSIASVNFVAMIVRELNFTRRLIGQVILASAIIDDGVGWIIVSIIFSLAARGEVEGWVLAQSVIGTLLFMAVSLTIGRRAVFFIIRWVNDMFHSDFAVVTVIIAIMGGMSLITYAIGVHTVLGAFVAGVLVGESPILTKHIDEQLRGLITAFFAPVFFGLAGQNADLTVLSDPTIAIYTVGLVLIASFGKFGGAFAGGKLSGLTWREGFALACGMNARGSTEVIIATVGLSMGVLNRNLFTMIVAMAVITTVAMPPTLRWALSRIPMRKEEKKRIEREEMEARGFVSNLERLLIAVDDSPNGKFISRAAGMLAGTHSMPTTVLHITAPDKIEQPKAADKAGRNKNSKDKDAKEDRPVDKAEEKKAEQTGEAVKEAAAEVKRKQENEEKVDTPVAVTTIVHEAPSPEQIAEEAEKGYDLMMIGLEKRSRRDRDFDDSVTTLALGFEGPLAVAAMRGELADMPDGKLNILVPVNGTEPARRGAEVAITMARATRCPLSVLYVALRDGKRGDRRSLHTRHHEEAILKDIVAIADGYNMSVRTAVLTDKSPEDAIMREAERHRHNLIVMGVGRRPGERLFFGDTAAALMQDCECSLLYVAS